jgi:formamidopyrimidine-DNA glycosylase
MPELPDLAVFAENLQARLQGRTVLSIECNTVNNLTPAELQEAICNSSIAAVRRVGKEMAFIFSNRATLLVHLMLRGEFAIVTDPHIVDYRVVTLRFEDEALVVSDPKGQVVLKLNPPTSSVPDALEVGSAYLRKKISERPRKQVKAFLIDQSLLRGIGNAYVDEILWQARISPKSIIGKIPDYTIDVLLTSIKSVLTDAIEQIKQRSPQAISGEVRDFLRVHNPRRSQSPTGYPIMTEKVASRITYFTEEQVLFG